MNRSRTYSLPPLCRFAVLALQLTLCVFGFASMASASPLVVSGGGTFLSNAPASAYSAPGGTFSFSFDVDSHPSVTLSSNGNYFKTSFTNLSYVLNGASASTTGSQAYFYSEYSAGMFDVCLTATCDAKLQFTGPQVYTGSESSPTIVAGSYTHLAGAFANNFNAYTFTPTEPVTISPAGVTPEPSSLLLLGTGVLGVAGMARQRFRR